MEDYLKDNSTIEDYYHRTNNQLIVPLTLEQYQKNWEDGLWKKLQTDFMHRDNTETLDSVKEEFSRENRILCVSNAKAIEPHGDILMWAHYSNGHRGVKISFDTQKIGWVDLKIDRVQYLGDRVMLDLIKMDKKDPTVMDEIKRALIVKSPGWEYEQEYRWFISIKRCELDNEKRLHFVKIPAEAITCIDIGVKASPKIKKRIMDLIGKKNLTHTKIRYANLHETKFALSYESQIIS